jgi:hypothetical protein
VLPSSAHVEAWAAAWASARTDFDAYAAHYDLNFWQGERNQEAWLAYRRSKIDRTSCIEVHVEDVRLVDAYKTVFTQRYVSDRYCDVGEKTLEWIPLKRGTEWTIIGEIQPSAEPCPQRCTPAPD